MWTRDARSSTNGGRVTRSLTNGLLGLLLTGLLLIAGTGTASAHGDLTGGSPGPGDEVVPGVVTLRLALEEVDPDAPLAVAVTDEAGEPVAVGEAQVVGAGHVCAAVDPLTAGVWTVDYAGTGLDGHRFGSRFAFEAVPGGEQADPGPCADAELAEPGDAQTLAEMTETDTVVPVWLIWGLVVLGLLAAVAVVARVRSDRAADDV